jgi:hypothetical protein
MLWLRRRRGWRWRWGRGGGGGGGGGGGDAEPEYHDSGASCTPYLDLDCEAALLDKDTWYNKYKDDPGHPATTSVNVSTNNLRDDLLRFNELKNKCYTSARGSRGPDGSCEYDPSRPTVYVTQEDYHRGFGS